MSRQSAADFDRYQNYVKFCRLLHQQPMDFEKWWKIDHDKIGYLNALAPVDYIGHVGYR